MYAAVDALGNPLKPIPRLGQRADILEVEALAEPCVFEALIADKGFDSTDFVDWIAAREAEVVIPSRKTSIVQRTIDTNLYKDRNKIERFLAHQAVLAYRDPLREDRSQLSRLLTRGLDRRTAPLIVNTL